MTAWDSSQLKSTVWARIAILQTWILSNRGSCGYAVMLPFSSFYNIFAWHRSTIANMFCCFWYIFDCIVLWPTVTQVLAMKGLPPSQKEERGLDLKKKYLRLWVDPASKGSNLKIRWWLGNIPNPREKDVDLFYGFLMLGCVVAICSLIWYYARSALLSEKEGFMYFSDLSRLLSLSILPLPRYNPDLSGSETGQLTVNEKACFVGNSVGEKTPEWCMCFAFYLWALCFCMQHNTVIEMCVSNGMLSCETDELQNATTWIAHNFVI